MLCNAFWASRAAFRVKNVTKQQPEKLEIINYNNFNYISIEIAEDVKIIHNYIFHNSIIFLLNIVIHVVENSLAYTGKNSFLK